LTKKYVLSWFFYGESVEEAYSQLLVYEFGREEAVLT
jgi:hypothetical protein